MNQDFFDDKNTYEVVTVDNKEYRDFLNSAAYNLAFVPENYRDHTGLVMKSDAVNFSKWLRQKKPELNIVVYKADKNLVLRSDDFWLPLVFLANNVALPMYLDLVSSYVYDRMRGALRGEKARVHLEVIYEDKQEGVSKKLRFEGNVDELKKIIKKFDLNEFLDK